eukprot:gb/GEZN01008537.1/.p1 GENE.gb/GEZN01008537.1/~~gb/GEZN01008537.1/.p1  ORF type:complete len:404 (-),score=50.23 gb/GEZN01008537.1/:151-1362(-)
MENDMSQKDFQLPKQPSIKQPSTKQLSNASPAVVHEVPNANQVMSSKVNYHVVVVRYYATVTPRDEGSVVKWKNAPDRFNGLQLAQALEEMGVELKDHLAQVYEPELNGYSNCDEDAEFEFGATQRFMQLDVRLTPLKTGTLKSKESLAPTIILQERPLANPGPLGLFCFALTTMCLMIYELEMVAPPMLAWVVPMAFVYGGACQLLVGMWEIYRNNLFGAVAFSSYGGFWLTWGLNVFWNHNGLLHFAGTADQKADAKATWLCIWGFFTGMMFVQTLWITRGLQAVFFVLTFAFFFLAGGAYNKDSLMVGGILGFITALAAFYVGVAELMNDLQKRTVLPLGRIDKRQLGYGNSAPGAGATLVNDPDSLVSLRARLNKKQSLTVAQPGNDNSPTNGDGPCNQ